MREMNVEQELRKLAETVINTTDIVKYHDASHEMERVFDCDTALLVADLIAAVRFETQAQVAKALDSETFHEVEIGQAILLAAFEKMRKLEALDAHHKNRSNNEV